MLNPEHVCSPRWCGICIILQREASDAVDQAIGSSSQFTEKCIKAEPLRKEESTHLILSHTGGSPNGEEERGRVC